MYAFFPVLVNLLFSISQYDLLFLDRIGNIKFHLQ